jgi:virulence-associated protein VapD
LINLCFWNTSDQSRMSVLVRSIEQLKLTTRLGEVFRDIKCTSGVITSFERILAQINSARIYQMHRLFQRLPLTFATRCTLFSNCVSRLKIFYLDERKDLASLVCLLRKLKSFDQAKDLFDAEVEICDTIHRLIKQYWEEEGVGDPVEAEKKKAKAEAEASKNSPTSSTRRVSIVPAGKQLVHLNMTHREHTRERVELCEAVGRSRMFALNLLKQMGVDIVREMMKLHEAIKHVIGRVSAADVSKMAAAEQKRQQKQHEGLGVGEEDEGSITVGSVNTHDEMSVLSEALLSGTHSTLREIGNAITILRSRVNDNISAQQLLNEGHLIVGAADCALEASAMDSFADMDRLEDFFRSKYQTCTAILEANNTLHRLASVKLGTCDVAKVYHTYKNTLGTIAYLQLRSDSHGTIALLQQLLDSLQPMLEIVAFLKSPSIKARHWLQINKRVFVPCDFLLTLDSDVASIDTVVIADANVSSGAVVRGDKVKRAAAQVIGKIRSVPVASLVDRGVGLKIAFLKSIGAEACVEGMIEQTLDAATEVMHTCVPALSSDWMHDKFISEKLFFQLHRVTNCIQLGIILQYCIRAVIVAEHTAIDMHIDLFTDRIEYLKLVLYDMLSFIRNIDHIQVKWLSLFHFVKYANQGELDRDTERSFQSTCEDIKRIENVIQTANGKTLFAAVQMARDLNMALHTTVQKLEDISEDIHASTQSMLDACPRLVMLPYHRTKKLLKCWLTSPYHNIDYVNACLSEMFPGVGHLEIMDIPLQKIQLCVGFTSSDQREKIRFGETVLLNDPIEDFIRKFEYQLRLVLSRSCDMIIVGHIQLLKDMTGDLAADTLVECVRDVFRLRLGPILKPTENSETDEKPNQSTVLVNQALFAEHVWLALGFPIGSALIARADLAVCKQMMTRQWRLSVHHLIDECSDNVGHIHEYLQDEDISQEKKSLFSTLFQLEISFINTLDELLLSPCLESAIELWAGKYQLRFLYDKSERVKNSPFEVTLGCVSIPYGLEYQGGTVSAATGHRIESALQKVVGSACSYKGTVFFSRDDENTAAEAIGEYAVNCKDVATALGKVYTTLATVNNDRGIKLFLSRLIYLDALGCIDFTTLDMNGLQSILATLAELWAAVEKKDDFFMVGTLKYPLKTKQGATTVQMNRRKHNMQGLRQSLAVQSKEGIGVFIVGVASETLYADSSVLDYFGKSSFNIFAVENNRPVEDMGLLLAMSGFKYGALLQMIFQEVIKCLHDKFQYQDNISFLSSSLLIRTILKQCKAGLIIGKLGLHRLNGGVTSDQDELRLEMECLYSAALEQVVLLGQCSKQELSEVHSDVRKVMQDHVNTILDEDCRFQLAASERVTHLVIPQRTRAVIERSMTSLGLLPGGMFVEQAATLFGAVASSNPLVIVSGPVGCGECDI